MKINRPDDRDRHTDLAKDLTGSVAHFEVSHPLVPDDMPVYGYIYDVKTGKLIEVST